MGPRLTFFGGAGTVTGSKYLVEAERGRFLLDCGLFQGLKRLRLRNWEPPPFEPKALDGVILSHGHLDHSGYLPVLVKHGFRGPIHCTRGTQDLLKVLLLDSARLQEEDARRANKYGYSKHRPALPLYTLEDAQQTLSLVRAHGYGERFELGEGSTVLLRRAGHILGSATVELDLGGTQPSRLVFSGDLGRWDRPIIRDPEFVPEADVLLVESTYGDRVHANGSEETLVRVITETAHRGGAVIVPSFAIGRTQELIWTIRKLEDEGRLPLISVFIDTPMGIDVTRIYCEHPEDHDVHMRLLTDAKRCPLCCREYHLVRTAQESKSLHDKRGPMVIIAGSGMATGGRVLHHLKWRLPDHRNTVLLVGYQAEGTRGRSLQEGARSLRIHGEDIPVRAHVETVDGLSAHADQSALLRWMRGFTRPPRQTYVVHGEPGPAQALAVAIREQLGWKADVAEDGATVELVSSAGSSLAR
ncbi:MBL fold metallo-hydrolase RNA specificity domain-containing protein [Hyalangium gracile]|uniref:MBL fold metallo-hydrolase RNA specificity domain-containing protein n=1 Tax=Hyalangium gracile TaxID=394092 RepID=UPI001CCA0040|nr:MBL fold metallo-hydrolase [Hyalangium gracile]